MTSEQIDQLRALARKDRASDPQATSDVLMSVPGQELVARLLERGGLVRLLDERELLLNSLVELVYDNRPGGGADARARRAIAVAEGTA